MFLLLHLRKEYSNNNKKEIKKKVLEHSFLSRLKAFFFTGVEYRMIKK